MKYAIVDDATKVVVNMIVWDGVTQLEGARRCIGTEVSIELAAPM